MKIEAVFKENGVKVILEIVPYGLFVYQDEKRNYEIEQKLIMAAQEMLTEELRKELEGYGGERPEGYVYYYAVLHAFDGLLKYEHNQLITLFPGDFTFRRIDILTQETVSTTVDER